MLSKITIWFCIAVAVAAALTPDIVVKTIENLIERNKVNKLKKLELQQQSPVSHIALNTQID